MIVVPQEIPEILLIETDVHIDERGFFLETFNAQKFHEAGLPDQFQQDNHTGSRRGTLRGLHYQIRYAQGKLIRVLIGEIFDVSVDLRRSSSSFGQWVGKTLSADDHQVLWIPAGFAHGFYVLSEWAEVLYKVTDRYAPEWERTLLWNDPQVNIKWPLKPGEIPLLSERDSQGERLDEAEVYE
jgi:dTDP-4-dehydrorhamnose 3,5-epimerase